MLSFIQWLKDKNLLKEENNLSFFFKKGKRIYGSTEDGRMTFARMKNPDKEDEKWIKDAMFTAVDLENSSKDSHDKLTPFRIKDLEDVKPIDQEEAEKELAKKGKKIPNLSDSEEEVGEN